MISDRLKSNLNQYQVLGQEQNYKDVNAFTQKGRKLQALKEKILTQKLTHYNNVFKRYVEQIETDIEHNQKQLNNNNNNKKNTTISREKVKRKQRISKQLQLPFQMYIYSSTQSQTQQNQKILTIQNSTSSNQSSQNKQQQSSNKHQSSQNKQQLINTIEKQKQLIQNRMFSFAKQNNNKRYKYSQVNVLRQVNKSEEMEMLEKLIDKKNIQQMVERYTRVYLQSTQNESVYNKNDKQLQNKLQRLVMQQVSDTLSPFYMNINSQLIDQINTQYLQRVYIPTQELKLQQMIYFKKQQSLIKVNQLQTLQSILKQLRNNQHIQQLININKFKPSNKQLSQQSIQYQNKNKHKKLQNNLIQQHQNQIIESNNKVNVNKNRIPSLPLKEIKRNINQFHHQKPFTQRLQQRLTQRQQQKLQQRLTKRLTERLTERKDNSNKESDRQRSVNSNNMRNKPGRTYQYKNKNDPQIKSYKQQNNYLNKDCMQNDKKYNLASNEEDGLYKIRNNQNQYQQRSKNRNQEPSSFNNLLQQFNNKQKYNKHQRQQQNPQSQGLLQLKKLQLDQQYSKNIQAVLTFEIEYLKAQLDRVKQEISYLNIQYQNKYKSIQLNNRIHLLNSQYKKIKNKLKHKIKLFWIQTNHNHHHQQNQRNNNQHKYNQHKYNQQQHQSIKYKVSI